MKIITKLIATSCLILIAARSNAQCATPSVVPYWEGFQGITANNQLPACWLASSMSVTCLTNALVSNKHASFFHSPAGANYFYSNGIQLSPGMTYSASIWYKTDNSGGTNWTDLSLLLGPNQSPAGLVSIVSSGGPALAASYTLLSHTFTVGSPGTYYIAVRGTATTGTSPNLYWDDLRVEMPCSAGNNSPNVTFSPVTTPTVCSDKPFTISATGADTYSWSTGDNTPVITVTPGIATSAYTVTGTKTLTGCSHTISFNIVVEPSPIMFLTTSSSIICAGSSVNLTAVGNGITSYTWNPLGTGSTNIVVVSPTITTTYTVEVSNAFGCSSKDMKTITVYPSPTIISSPSSVTLCEKESAVLTASGGISYTWTAPGGSLSTGTSLVSYPLVTTCIYTLNGSGANACTASTTITFSLTSCVGLDELSSEEGFKIYPSPAHEQFYIDTKNELIKSVEIFDPTGALVFSATLVPKNERISVGINNLPNGIYFVRVRSDSKEKIMKVIKE